MNDIRVLIVDDEEELVATLAERFQLRGIQTQTATDGETALNIIQSDPPQVVLLDVMMPGMGGIEILKRINTLNLKLPVILLTGYGSSEQSNEGMKLGAFAYVMKPCDFDGLITKIYEAVGNK
jgi:DNA-binding NtrC family response regulator